MNRRLFLRYAAAALIGAGSTAAFYHFEKAPVPVQATLTVTSLQTVTETAMSTLSVQATSSASSIASYLLRPGEIVEHSPADDNPYAFYSYFPRSAVGTSVITPCVWPHGGAMPSDNYSDHKARAAETVHWLEGYSERYKLPIVVVAIPRVERLYVHSLHPGTFTTREAMLRRPDLKLIDAVWNQYAHSMRVAGLVVDERVLMMGFSSVGMFAHRFTMLHPDRVKAVWLGGEAPAPLPATELDGHPLNYPLGVRNLQSLTGNPFDSETYRNVPHFVCVGENDVKPENDTTTYTDIFTENERLFIRSHFGSTNPERVRFFYEFLVSMGVPAQFRLYEGVGHAITDEIMIDAFDFLVRQLTPNRR